MLNQFSVEKYVRNAVIFSIVCVCSDWTISETMAIRRKTHVQTHNRIFISNRHFFPFTTNKRQNELMTNFTDRRCTNYCVHYKRTKWFGIEINCSCRYASAKIRMKRNEKKVNP